MTISLLAVSLSFVVIIALITSMLCVILWNYLLVVLVCRSFIKIRATVLALGSKPSIKKVL